jgi:hypothetical protein
LRFSEQTLWYLLLMSVIKGVHCDAIFRIFRILIRSRFTGYFNLKVLQQKK